MNPSTWGRQWTRSSGRPTWITSTSAGKKARGWFSAAKSPIISSKGYFVEPTIFDNVDAGHAHFQRRDFRSRPRVSTAKIIDEALAFANGVEYGLTTSIFTENIDTIMRFVEEVETGMVHVNEPTIGGEAQLPFGGTKATGVGEREMAEEGLNFFTELKTVFINYSGKAERLMIR